MRVWISSLLASFAGAVLLALSGCSSVAIRPGDFAEPTVRTELQAAGISDLRDAFARSFCRHYARYRKPDDPACAHWILQADTPAQEPGAASLLPDNAVRTVVVIPGIFGECVSRWVTPYSADKSELEQLGYRVIVVNVSGRGSSAQNAARIHQFFAQHPAERAIVIGYSKGTTDFMLAASQPQAQAWNGRIAAFVSVAGVVNGTPLASHGEGLYQALLARMPLALCQPEDGGGVASLSYLAASQTRKAFAARKHPYPVYSLAAIADRGAVNPFLQPSHALLAKLDGRNDGQVLLDDTIVPGSRFLGSFRADHWSIALPFEDSDASLMRAFSSNNRFPRRALIVSVLDFVNRNLPGETR